MSETKEWGWNLRYHPWEWFPFILTQFPVISPQNNVWGLINRLNICLQVIFLSTRQLHALIVSSLLKVFFSGFLSPYHFSIFNPSPPITSSFPDKFVRRPPFLRPDHNFLGLTVAGGCSMPQKGPYSLAIASSPLVAEQIENLFTAKFDHRSCLPGGEGRNDRPPPRERYTV